MPIHDQGYLRYGGTRAAVGRSWQVIAGAGIRSIIGKRAFIALMLFAWAPFVVRAVQIYVSANFQQAAFLAPKGETFREFLDQQGVFVFFVTIWVGAGLIANDRRANALQLVPVEAAHHKPLDDSPAWSPDGPRIAVHTKRAGNWDVGVLYAATGEMRILTLPQNNDQSPVWTPDGKALVYQSADFSHKLVTVRVDGLLTAP